ncbi:hypothetical protein LTR78_010600 [Recurvomyces mirabilis]|uniref:Uncharacterized protein n=1 Tax=Recurvomyces mirabilis TaxID=574656 RepID=A0AAE0TMV5_9PEZI|nr:hypothetical protein LTR78_010600 [Recurvomyces mirabilis]KAK5160182.1 hypothetical protein LTS14_002289 [Recurvomyces mirabilis]
MQNLSRKVVIPDDLMGRKVFLHTASSYKRSSTQTDYVRVNDTGRITTTPNVPFHIGVLIKGQQHHKIVDLRCVDFGAPPHPIGRFAFIRENCTATDGSRVAMNTIGKVVSQGQNETVIKIRDKDGKTIEVACKWLQFGAPADAVGRTFRCVQRYNDNGFRLEEASYGVVESIDARGWRVKVRVMGHNGGTGHVTADRLEFGGHGSGWRLARGGKFSSTFGKIEGWDYRRQLLTLLETMYEDRALVDEKNPRYWKLLDNDPKRQSLAIMIYKGTPDKLVKLYDNAVKTKKKITMLDIRNACPKVQKSDKLAAVYLQLCHGFTEGPRQGHKPYHYGGQSIDVAHRTISHLSDPKTKKKPSYYSTHYDVFRAADEVDTVMLYKDGRGSSTTMFPDDRLKLDLIEQVKILLLKMTKASQLTKTVDITGLQSEVQQEAVKASSFSHNSRVLNAIAERSFEKSGWVGLGQNPFDCQDGLNTLQPIGRESALPDYESVLWSRTKLNDRCVFRRAPITIAKNGNQKMLFSFAKARGEVSETVTLTVNDDIQEPSLGEKVWVQIEIMDKGLHACPYAALPLAGGWSNWEEALGVGITIFWQTKGQWFSRNVRSQGYAIDNTIQGGVGLLSSVIALKHHLQRQEMQSPPPPFAAPRLASVVDMKFDFFHQTVTTRRVMEVTKLTNIGTAFSKSKPILERLAAEVKQASNNKSLNLSARQRVKCDRCATSEDYVKGKVKQCYAVTGSDKCQRCWVCGLECSFTRQDTLMGPRYPGHIGGPNFQKIYSALFYNRSTATERMKQVHEISDPGFVEIDLKTEQMKADVAVEMLDRQ